MKIFKVLFSAIPSFVALLFSFLIDLGYVPFFGNVTHNFLKAIYPQASMLNESVEPVSLWYLPFIVYILNILFIIYVWYKINKSDFIFSSYQTLIFFAKKYKNLFIVFNLIPLLFAVVFEIAAIKLGPTVLLGFALPFLAKSIGILFIALLMLNIINEMVIQYFPKVKEKNISE
jgi:hypothetical protein